jgi:hypothetical protein
MKRSIAFVCFATALSASIHFGVRAQVDERVLAFELLNGDTQARSNALARIREIGVKNAGPELRSALIEAQIRANSVVAEAARRGMTLDQFANPEEIAALSRTVAELNDPLVIPALSKAIYGNFVVIHALARFGEQALPAVLEVVNSAKSSYDEVIHGLTVLQLMVERLPMQTLSTDALAQIRSAARHRLSGEQYFTVLWKAIDLACVAGDAELRELLRILQSIRQTSSIEELSIPALSSEHESARRIA